MTYPSGPWTPAGPPAERMRPGVGRFWLAGGIALMGIVVAGVLLVRSLFAYVDRIDELDRLAVPGERVLDVHAAGGYTIYAEGHRVADPGVVNVRVTIEPLDEGPPLDLRPYGTRVEYDFADREGVALYSVRIAEPGRYRLIASGEEGIHVAFGRGLGHGLTGGIVAALAVGTAGVVGGVVLAVVTGIQRGRRRREQVDARYGWSNPWAHQPVAPPGWGHQGPWGPPPPPPGGGPGTGASPPPTGAAPGAADGPPTPPPPPLP